MKNIEILVRILDNIKRDVHIIFIPYTVSLDFFQSILDSVFGESVYIIRIFTKQLFIVSYQKNTTTQKIRFGDVDCIHCNIIRDNLTTPKNTIKRLFNQCFFYLSSEETRLVIYHCMQWPIESVWMFCSVWCHIEAH